MKEEVVRSIDNLGRIVLPAEYRNALGWNCESKVSVTREGSRLVLQTYQGSCYVCGNEEKLTDIHGKHICQNCIDKLNS